MSPTRADRTDDQEEQEAVTVRLHLALLGRLLVVSIVLGGLLFLTSSSADQFTPRLIRGLIVVAYLVSGAGAFALKQGQPPRVIAAVNVLTDLFLTTALVYVTGGADSGFTFLFGGVVLEAALVGSGRSTGVVATVALLFFFAITLGMANGWIPPPSDQPHAGQLDGANLAQALLRSVVALMLVGGLATLLSERLQRTRGELREASAVARGHAQLTEDIVRSLASGLLTLDSEERIQSVNPAAAQLLHADTDALLGTSVTEYFDTSTPDASRRESQARAADGFSFPIGYTRAPLRTVDGTVHGSIVIFQDLTELAALRQRASRADRLAVLGSLAAGLAHEIRNPLGSIAGSVELVRESDALSAEDKQLLDAVLRETDRLNELVTTMLEVGKPGLAERRAVPIVPLCREVLELAAKGAPRGLALKLESHRLEDGKRVEESEIMSLVDPSQVRQVLWNLVRNAIQFSPEGGTVTLVVSRSDEATSFEVRDEGSGVPEADRANVFDMFFTRRRGGMGLGLALSRQLVEGHGGQIGYLPNTPRGSVFHFTLPDASRPSEPA